MTSKESSQKFCICLVIVFVEGIYVSSHSSDIHWNYNALYAGYTDIILIAFDINFY